MQLRSRLWLAAAAALLAVPDVGSAQQLQVFVFGDAGIVSQNAKATPLGAANGGGESLSLNSGPWQASRIGFRGKQKINDDFDAWFDAATTLNLVQGLFTANSNGATNGIIWFDRNAFVGVASKKYGNLTFGRHAGTVTEAIWVTDPLKANNGATNLNGRYGYMFGAGNLLLNNFGTNTANNGNGIGLDRQSNSAKYVLQKSDFIGMAMYGFGGATGDRGKNQYLGFLLGYDSDGAASHGPTDRWVEGKRRAVQVRVAGQAYSDNGAVIAAPGVDAANPKIQWLYSGSAGAVFRYDDIKLKVNWTNNHIASNNDVYRKLDTTIYSAGVTYSLGDLDLTAAYYNFKRTARGFNDQNQNAFYFVPEWYVTKSFWLYGIAQYQHESTTAAQGFGTFNTSGAVNQLAPGYHGQYYLALGISFYFNS
jgi:predicted porin